MGPLTLPPQGQVIGMGRLARALCEREDLTPVWSQLQARIAADPQDADAIFDSSLILRLTGQLDDAQTYLRAALDLKACYTCRHGRADRLAVLVLVAGADVTSNAPVDMVLDSSDLTAHYFHLDAAGAADLPAHDVALVAIGEDAKHQPILRQMSGVLFHWPRPVMNAQPERIADMTRDQVNAALAGAPGLLAPRTVQVDRASLLDALAAGGAPPVDYPLTIRPVGTDCGKGLEKVEDVRGLAAYLERYPEELFFLAPFIDYSDGDGQFRKYRITFIDGRPYPAHMAISPDWVVHYLSAGMTESAAKRAEEAAWMDTFDLDFAARHAAALQSIQDRVGVDYFSIDCAEARDGRLLFFEADVASIVHDLDPADLFPYKKRHMKRLFSAFIEALERRAAEAPEALNAA
jgi:hypothetical protein